MLNILMIIQFLTLCAIYNWTECKNNITNMKLNAYTITAKVNRLPMLIYKPIIWGEGGMSEYSRVH